MQVSEQQIQHFRTFGYLMIPAAFSPEEMTVITGEFDTAMRDHGNGTQHDGSTRTMFGSPIDRTRILCALLDDQRITALFNSLLGQDFNYCGGDGNYLTGDTGWHADGNWGSLFGIKLIFYLDSLTRDTGCLRVLPGSHDPEHFVRKHFLNINRSQELFSVASQDFPGSVALETSPGDLVLFNHDLYHSSWGGGTRRRMFTINCIKHCKTKTDIALARRYLSVHMHRVVQRCELEQTKVGGMYFPLMLETAGGNRRTHLVQPSQIYDELFPQLSPRQSSTSHSQLL